jgi:hypothetical protein
MAHSIRSLPSATQNLLKLASCIGTTFDLPTLATISGQDPKDVARGLWKALVAGLVVAGGDNYFVIKDTDNDRSSTSSPSGAGGGDKTLSSSSSTSPLLGSVAASSASSTSTSTTAAPASATSSTSTAAALHALASGASASSKSKLSLRPPRRHHRAGSTSSNRGSSPATPVEGSPLGLSRRLGQRATFVQGSGLRHSASRLLNRYRGNDDDATDSQDDAKDASDDSDAKSSDSNGLTGRDSKCIINDCFHFQASHCFVTINPCVI